MVTLDLKLQKTGNSKGFLIPYPIIRDNDLELGKEYILTITPK